MIEIRVLSPADEACLRRAYPSSQKGGTLIVDVVDDLEVHEQHLGQPDGYHPAAEKRRLLGLVLSNTTWKDDKLTAECRQPFAPLARNVVAFEKTKRAEGAPARLSED